MSAHCTASTLTLLLHVEDLDCALELFGVRRTILVAVGVDGRRPQSLLRHLLQLSNRVPETVVLSSSTYSTERFCLACKMSEIVTHK